jgi:hypothetical protein
MPTYEMALIMKKVTYFFCFFNSDVIFLILSSVADPGLFIPDPDFYPSRIQNQQQERGEKKFVVIPFYVATNFTKLKIILVFKW